MFLKNLAFLLIVLSFTSCVKNAPHKEEVAEPRGFQAYTKDFKTNSQRNLIFLHVHHCPNCDLTIKHLIQSDEFQELTKNYNRFHLEIGRPLGRELMDKYEIRGGPIFVLTDPQFNLISKSPYGFLDLSSFSSWLQSEKALPPPGEVQVLSQLIKLISDKKTSDYEGLYQLFREQEKLFDPKNKQKIMNMIDQAEKELGKWRQQKFSKDSAFGNYYRISLSYSSLAKLAEKVDPQKAKYLKSVAYEEGLKIRSGDTLKDYGSLILQMWSLMGSDRFDEVEELEERILKENPKNRILLYNSMAYGYLNFKKDCNKVFEYTSKIALPEIPVETERINLMTHRIECHGRNRDLKNAEKDYAHLNQHISEEIKKAFPKKIAKIEKVLTELKK